MLAGMTPGSIIDALGGTGEVAAALRLSDSTVAGWRKRRGGIPAPHWSALVDLARERGQPDVTLQALASLVAREPASAA